MTITTATNVSAIGSLILLRLLVAGDKGDTSAKITKDLESLLSHRWEGRALTERIDQAVAELESTSLVALVRGKSKKAAPRVLLTALGRQQALNFLGAAQLKPKTTWAVIKKTYLPACALGLSALSDTTLKALSTDTGFKAVVLTKQFELPLNGCPTLKDATGALSWKLIGFDSTKPFTVALVQKALLDRELGEHRPPDAKKVIDRLLAQRLGARRDDSKELRSSVVRGWIDQQEGKPPADELTQVSPAPVSRSALTQPASEFDLPSFAERVKAAARICTTGRFGDSKIFIAHVWRALQADPTFRTMTLVAFKERLAEANNARLLDLSRADLVQAMDPDDVRESEVHYLNARFHFVRI
jgi:hypothetical protein